MAAATNVEESRDTHDRAASLWSAACDPGAAAEDTDGALLHNDSGLWVGETWTAMGVGPNTTSKQRRNGSASRRGHSS